MIVLYGIKHTENSNINLNAQLAVGLLLSVEQNKTEKVTCSIYCVMTAMQYETI